MIQKLVEHNIAKQKEKIEQEKTLFELADGTDGPSLDANGTPERIDQTAKTCKSAIAFKGNQTFPHVAEYELGSNTGNVEVIFLPISIPDRAVVIIDGRVVLDTGYCGVHTSSNQQNLNIALAAKGLPSSPITKYNAVQGNIAYWRFNWYKTTATPKAYVYIYAPIPGTEWEFVMGCPGEALNLSLYAGGTG